MANHDTAPEPDDRDLFSQRPLPGRTTDLHRRTFGPARDVFDLTVYAVRDGRARIGDGTERFWVKTAALYEVVRDWPRDTDEEAGEYARWCRESRADQTAYSCSRQPVVAYWRCLRNPTTEPP